jgi:hypothetical protein
MAEGYPDDPTPPVRRNCAAFLLALPWMLPCESCGYHFRRFLLAYEGSADRVASGRSELRRFLTQAHNEVTRHTRPGAAPWTEDDARDAYGSSAAAPAAAAPAAAAALEWIDRSVLLRSTSTAGCACSKHGRRRRAAGGDKPEHRGTGVV